ncbi:MAG: Na+/H+ antiporter subunit E [Gammaproteobacteria bacterium]
MLSAARSLMLPAIARATVYGFLWWAITEGRGASWFGAVIVAVVTVISLWLAPPGGGWRWRALPGFLVWFVRESLRGGIDVARRALHPRLPLAPGFIDHRWRLARTPARVLMTNLVSLLPGTLSVEYRDRGLRVHVIDRQLPVAAELDDLEARIARLLEPVPDGRDGARD